MKIYILGSGAMGTLYGTEIIKNNYDVTFFVTQKQTLQQIQENPYAERISEDNTEKIKVIVKELDGKTQYEPADFIIIFVKTVATQQTIQLAKTMNLGDKNTVILTCQGGFDNPKYINQLVPSENILVGCTQSFSKSAGTMKISNFSFKESLVWPYKCQEQPNDLCKQIVQKLDFLQLKLSPAANADIYKMQLYYTANIAVSAICDMSFGAVNDQEQGHQLLMNLADECAKVSEAYGVSQDLFNSEIARKAVIELAITSGPHFGSMNADLKNGRKTEIEGTSGALIRMAKEKNIQIPYTESVYCLVKLLESKQQSK